MAFYCECKTGSSNFGYMFIMIHEGLEKLSKPFFKCVNPILTSFLAMIHIFRLVLFRADLFEHSKEAVNMTGISSIRRSIRKELSIGI